jgi:hypothetical protein
MKVTVAICKDRKCKTYVVLSDKLSVQYVCNESYFGVEKLDKAFEKDGYKTSDTELNRSEYFHQKVIAPGKRGEVEATQLIAAYFPMFNPAQKQLLHGKGLQLRPAILVLGLYLTKRGFDQKPLPYFLIL